MIKALSKLDINENFLHITRGINEKPTANIIFNSD